MWFRKKNQCAAASREKLQRSFQYGVWALAGSVLGGGASVVVCAPASWLALGVEHVSQGRIQLLDAVGTIWSGSSVVVLTGGDGSRSQLALPSRLQWRVQWASGLQFVVRSACCTSQDVIVHFSTFGIHMPAGDVHLPLALLQGLGSPWNTVGVSGQLDIHWSGVNWSYSGSDWKLSGSVEAVARGVASSLSTLAELGNYRLQVALEPQTKLTLSTVHGALQLQGQGQWQKTGFQFQGEGRAAPEQAVALANLLTLLGNKQGNVTKIKWD